MMRRKNRKKWAALFAILMAAIVLLLLIMACYTYWRLDRLSENAVPFVGEDMENPGSNLIPSGQEAEANPETENPQEKTKEQVATLFKEIYHEDVINILLIGQDTQSGDHGRSDTMILLSNNQKERSVCLISFMRDILIPIEGRGLDRLNHAYSYGGPGLCINTINQNFDLDIQKYVVIHFDEMIELIDLIGGIDVSLSKEEAALYNGRFGWNLQEGVNHLAGQMALSHSRNRTIGSDFERTRRQRDILVAVYNRLLEHGGRENIFHLIDLVNQVSKMVRTNMSPWEIIALANNNINKDTDIEISLDRIPIDGTWKSQTYSGMRILKTDIEANREHLRSLIYAE